MSEENIYNSDEIKDRSDAEAGTEDVQSAEDSGSDVYVYEVEDDIIEFVHRPRDGEEVDVTVI